MRAFPPESRTSLFFSRHHISPLVVSSPAVFLTCMSAPHAHQSPNSQIKVIAAWRRTIPLASWTQRSSSRIKILLAVIYATGAMSGPGFQFSCLNRSTARGPCLEPDAGMAVERGRDPHAVGQSDRRRDLRRRLARSACRPHFQAEASGRRASRAPRGHAARRRRAAARTAARIRRQARRHVDLPLLAHHAGRQQFRRPDDVDRARRQRT